MQTETQSPKPGTRNPGKIGDRIIKAGLAVLAAHVCVKLAGLVGKNIIPNYYGLAASATCLRSGTARCSAPHFKSTRTMSRPRLLAGFSCARRRSTAKSACLEIHLGPVQSPTGDLVMHCGVDDPVSRHGGQPVHALAERCARQCRTARNRTRHAMPYIAPGLLGHVAGVADLRRVERLQRILLRRVWRHGSKTVDSRRCGARRGAVQAAIGISWRRARCAAAL